MATTRGMHTDGRRSAIIASVRPGCESLQYTLDIEEDDEGYVDDRGPIVAMKALNRATRFDINRIDCDDRKIIVALRQHVTVTITRHRNGPDTSKCDCPDWDKKSRCSHIYWVLDEFTRSTLQNPPGGAQFRARDLRISPFASQITVGRRDPRRINPESLLRDRYDEIEVEEEIRRRRHPDRDEDTNRAAILDCISIYGPSEDGLPKTSWIKVCEYLADYMKRDSGAPEHMETAIVSPVVSVAVTMQRVKNEAERCFLAFHEHSQGLPHNQLARIMDEAVCKRNLEDCAGWALQQCRKIRDISDDAEILAHLARLAANPLLYMLRGVILQDVLFAYSLHDDPDSLWGAIFEGIDLIRHLIPRDEIETLRDLYLLASDKPDFDERHTLFRNFYHLSEWDT